MRKDYPNLSIFEAQRLFEPAGFVPPADILLPGSKRMQKCLRLQRAWWLRISVISIRGERVPRFYRSAPGRGLFLWGPVGVENFYSRVSWRHQYNTPRSLRRRRQARGEKNSPVRRGRCAPTASLVHSFLNSSPCESDMLHAMAGPFLLTLLGQQKDAKVPALAAGMVVAYRCDFNQGRTNAQILPVCTGTGPLLMGPRWR